MLPENGGRAAFWKKIRFPGPVGVQRPAAARGLKVIVPEKENSACVRCCVIGSGAGGGVAGGGAGCGWKRCVGDGSWNYYDDADFDGAELARFQRLYLEGGFAGTQDQSVGFWRESVWARTVVNYCTSFRTPDDVREEWAEAGVKWIAGRGVHKEFGCGVRTAARESRPESRFSEGTGAGARAEGAWLHVDAMPRNVQGCDQGKNLRVLRIWMRDWGETIDDENVARGCAGEGRADIGGTRAERIRIEGGGATGCGRGFERRASRQREMQSGGGGVRSDSYGGVVGCDRDSIMNILAAFALASGFEHLRSF